MNLISMLLILLLLGCAQAGPTKPETGNIDNERAATADPQQAMLKQARALKESNPELFSNANGVLVTAIVPGSQGEKAGLKPGDILLTYDNISLHSSEHLIQLTGKKNENDSIRLTYLHNQELQNVVLQGSRIGVQIFSLMPSQSELLTQEMTHLIQLGSDAYRSTQYHDALKFFEKGVVIAGSFAQKNWQAEFLQNLGTVYLSLNQYRQALDSYEQALNLQREISNSLGEADNLGNLGIVNARLHNYIQARNYLQQSLKIHREIGNDLGMANSLNNLGNIYYEAGENFQALDQYQQALDLSQKIGNPVAQAMSLNNIGNVFDSLSQYSQAIEYFQRSLNIERTLGNRLGEANTLVNLGNVYVTLNQYTQANQFLLQSLAIQRNIGDRAGEAKNLTSLGVVYSRLGQYDQAIDYHKKSLAIEQELGDHKGEAGSLTNLGVEYFRLNQNEQALGYFERSLEIARKFDFLEIQAANLEDLGGVYSRLKQYTQAHDYFQKSLVLEQKLGNGKGEAETLASLGLLNYRLGDYESAKEKLLEGLIIANQVSVPETLGRLWFILSLSLYKLNKIDEAIFSGKQAVNILQSLRTNNLSLEQNLQNSFLEERFFVYHELAEMLIEQGRLAEAEQVMAMLKEEEYFDFIQRDGQDDMRTTQAGYTRVEKGIVIEINQFSNQLVSLGKEYKNLEKLSLIDEQAKVRFTKVKKELEQAQIGFQKMLSALEARFEQVRNNEIAEFDIPRLKELQQKVLGKHQAVFISTLTTKNRFYLLLTTPEIQLVRESSVSARVLNDIIKRFRNALKHPGSDPIPLAQELYTYLIKPLEKDLQQAQTKTLMWSLDGALRYVPLATLHDGQQFLVEKYSLNLYTAAAHSDWHEVRVDAWRAAGLGVSQAHPGFDALPAVPNELRSIIRLNDNDQTGVLPGKIYLDREFSREAFKAVIQKPGYRVLHIASHFKLQPGDSSASKLLLGDGDTLSLDEFRRQAAFKLHDVDLLTLSACDTAVGDKGAGGEVESFAVMAQLRGANGVLASLWRVEDESTALLMQQLYRLLSGDGRLSKAEALRQAQIKLLRGEIRSNKNGEKFSHPYFWAPFVMMGNWL